MKILATIVSSLMVGLSMASSHFSPIQELQHFLTNKKKIFVAAGIAVIGFIFLIAGFIISLVEAALQYDAQGFVVWSALFVVATGLAVMGAFSLLFAKLLIPVRPIQQESLFGELNKQFNISQILESVMKNFAEAGAATPPRDATGAATQSNVRYGATAPEETSLREEQFSEPKTQFVDSVSPRDALHH